VGQGRAGPHRRRPAEPRLPLLGRAWWGWMGTHGEGERDMGWVATCGEKQRKDLENNEYSSLEKTKFAGAEKKIVDRW
jgi:hypothetical protein